MNAQGSVVRGPGYFRTRPRARSRESEFYEGRERVRGRGQFIRPLSSVFCSLTSATLSRLAPGPPPENLLLQFMVRRCLTLVKKYLYSPVIAVSEEYTAFQNDFPNYKTVV